MARSAVIRVAAGGGAASSALAQEYNANLASGEYTDPACGGMRGFGQREGRNGDLGAP